MADDEESTRQKSGGARRGVIVSLPREIRDIMKQRGLDTGITYTDLALDAVEQQSDELPEVFRAKTPTQRTGKIFARTAYQSQRGSRQDDEVTINLQLLATDVDILDRMWQEAGARSRNHYLATAISRYLKSDQP
ncbi:hypothetical protein ACFV9C_41920 [Kribbella sp. NPDC059898]|uniref:hypothetical protein n=1 Tax=Kribbella sp. NPDC059898 TaxID=3346995 RepID=UPI00365C7D5D